jgi:aarF domain-containing kinase
LLDVLWNDIGNVGKHRNKEVAILLYTFWNDKYDMRVRIEVLPFSCLIPFRNTREVMKGMNIAEFLDWCQAEDPIEHIHPDYVMISRVNVLLRGMGNAFGLQLNSASFWNKQAKALLKSKNIDFDE